MKKIFIASLITCIYLIASARSVQINLSKIIKLSFKDVITTVDRWSTASFETSYQQIIFGTDSYCECDKLMSDVSNVKCGKYLIKGNYIYLNNSSKDKPDFIYKRVKKILDENMGYMDQIVITRGRDVYMGSGVSTPEEKDAEIKGLKNYKKQPQKEAPEHDIVQ